MFLIEIFIATCVHDKIIRPYIGDVIVVILLYCLTKYIFNITTLKATIGVLVFSFFVEFLQYLNIVNWLGLSHNKLANIIIGNSFSWIDLVCYSVGITFVVCIKWIGGLLFQKIVLIQPIN